MRRSGRKLESEYWHSKYRIKYLSGSRRKENHVYVTSFPPFLQAKNEGWRIKAETDCCAKAEGERGGECWRRGRGWMCSTRGDGRRICETSLRKYAQLNFSTPMASPFSSSVPLPSLLWTTRASLVSSPACLAASSSSILRRSPFTSSPSNSPSGLLPLSFVPLRSLFFFRRSVLFLSRLSRPCSGPVLSLSSSAIIPACLSSTLALLSRRPCSRAVPLYLPPPVVPSSLKAMESNRWHRHTHPQVHV